MKFKVGDKVRVRRDLEERYDWPPSVNPTMAKMKGNILTIRAEIEPYGYKVHENRWHWSDDMLETVDCGQFPSFSEIVEETGIQEGDRVLINGHELTFTGETFVDKSGKRTNTKILGSDFKILPKPKTGAEILTHLKELRGDWEPDWEDDRKKYLVVYDHTDRIWGSHEWYAIEILGTLIFNDETINKALEYLNTLTEEESMNLLKEMRI